LIRTEEGEKPIEEVRAGDLVLSADPGTGKQSVQRVARAFVRRASKLITITTADGRRIEATPEHPFWVEKKGFVAAKKLARSDLFRSADGKLVAVAGVTSRRGEFPVYNFEVEGTHTYYAGGLWVHNQCGVNNPVPKTLARVVAGERNLTTLGAPGADDVFVTAAEDIAGLDAAGIAERLTIPGADVFTVVEFSVDDIIGLASPIRRTNPGWIPGGRTAGGAREFVVANGPIPPGALIRTVR